MWLRKFLKKVYTPNVENIPSNNDMTGNMTLRTDSIYGHSEPFGYDGMNRLTSGSEDSDPSGLQFIYRKREYLLLGLLFLLGLVLLTQFGVSIFTTG